MIPVMDKSEADPVLVDAVTRIFSELCTPDVINRAEEGEPQGQLWSKLCETAVPWAWVPEDSGGAGLSVVDCGPVLRLAGKYAVPAPVCETLIAGWLLARAGCDVPMTSLTVAPVIRTGTLSLTRDGRLDGEVYRVPYAAGVEQIIVIVPCDNDCAIVSVPGAEVQLSHRTNLAGEPLNDIRFDNLAVTIISRCDHPGLAEALHRVGALVRSFQMAGALERILDMTVDYALEREQFGRPIARFQAIQHNVAVLAEEAAAALCAADNGLLHWARFGIDDMHTEFAIAAAKVRCGEAAARGAKIAHQIHGAIGYAREYHLHQFTRRLWSWTDDFGSVPEWASLLGHLVCREGSKALWPTITAM